MKTYFDINLPSIPGKFIKFKIQDIKNRAFSIQTPRFKDNKIGLTNKFIQSFANFHSQALTTNTSETINNIPKKTHKSAQFRTFISDEKKGLVNLMQNIQNSSNLDITHNKGYTFNKSMNKSMHHPIQSQNLLQSSPLTDNYYFSQQTPSQTSPPVAIKYKPSAIFKNQSRTKYYSRMDRSTAPAVGTYNPFHKTQSKKKQSKKKNGDDPNNSINYKNFKEVICKIMSKQNQIEQQEILESKEVKNQHMFILDDRDRFGKQIYPIANKLIVPGPGAYDVVNSIQVHAKKIKLVEEQRKLLKQWFNN